MLELRKATTLSIDCYNYADKEQLLDDKKVTLAVLRWQPKGYISPRLI
ncbi:MAG: hypothetical protein ACI82S_001948 [Patiriisocius sp.]|jgi:hypothetical protein